MRIMVLHNHYIQSGGEDVVFAAEKELLRAHGHEVIEYVDDNARIEKMDRFTAAREVVWSQRTYNGLKKLICEKKPAIAHFHNTFLLISPSAYYACRQMNVPVVQTLHNFRFSCPNGIFYRDGRICEDCLGKFFAWPGVVHRCYRNSIAQTSVVAAMLAFHRMKQTWQQQINFFIALTEFSKSKFVQMGLPEKKIMVKPNFLALENDYESKQPGQHAVFVGRLVAEKGIDMLLSAWKLVPHLPLKICGIGPLQEKVIASTKNNPKIEYLGFLRREDLYNLLNNARLVVISSRVFENFPIAILEAFSCGAPVVAANLGSMAEIVRHGETGLLFEPGNPADLAAKAQWLWDHPEESARMGRNARREYEEKYTPERNYQMLMGIYHKALEDHA